MKFRWSNEEFLLTQQNTVLDDDTLYVHHEGILQAFQDHFYVVAHDLSIEVFEDTGDAVIGAELDYSVRYGEELDYLSDIVLLTDEEKKLFGPG